MSNLYAELRALMPPPVPDLGRSRSIDAAATRAALERAAASGTQVFWVLVTMICVLFVFELVLFIVWAAQPAKAAAVATGSGVSLPFLLYFLRDSWRTKVQADTLLALARSLDPTILQSVVKAFLGSVNATRAPKRVARAGGMSHPSAAESDDHAARS